MASERYNAPVREKHWQQVWNERGTFRTKDKSKEPKRYQLEMFPYPSGRIHMGHVRNYTLGDVMARYMRAKGFNVLHPMGWDAFGLPAENAAMERKVHPRQMDLREHRHHARPAQVHGRCRSTGSREFATCDPDYYVHQQRLFLDFLKKKLAYRKTAKVNWDPVENTVLANEQVIDGRGWRSGAVVEQRDLTQWFFKITAFADELLQALDGLAGQVAGFRVHAAEELDRQVDRREHAVRAGRRASCPRSCSTLEVFTTRHDTIFGASFMAISPEHPLAAHLAKKNKELAAFIEECRKIGTTEEALAQGREEGLRHRHRRRAPLQAGREAAGLRRQLHRHGLRHRRHLRLPGARPARPRFRPQVRASGGAGGAAAGRRTPRPSAIGDEAYLGDGTMINSEFLDGLTIEAAKDRIASLLEERGIGERKVNYRLRDWLLSRQRYWGCPIPVIHCETDGIVPVPVEDLPVQAAGGRHLRQARQPARPPPDLEAREVPQVRRAGACARPTPWTRSSTAPGTSSAITAPTRRHADRQEGAQILGAGRPVHRRQGARGPAPALRALLHARHEGDQARRTSTSRSRPCSRRASSCTRPTAARTATG